MKNILAVTAFSLSLTACLPDNSDNETANLSVAEMFANDDSTSADAERESEEEDGVKSSSLPRDVQKLPVHDGRCGGGGCDYFKLLESTTYAANVNGEMRQAKIWYGSSSDADATIKWAIKPVTVYFMCAAELPAVIFETEGKYRVDILDFINGVPNFYMTSENAYMIVCEKEGLSQLNQQQQLNLGYRDMSELFYQKIVVSDLNEVFDLLANQ